MLFFRGNSKEGVACTFVLATPSLVILSVLTYLSLFSLFFCLMVEVVFFFLCGSAVRLFSRLTSTFFLGLYYL